MAIEYRPTELVVRYTRKKSDGNYGSIEVSEARTFEVNPDTVDKIALDEFARAEYERLMGELNSRLDTELEGDDENVPPL